MILKVFSFSFSGFIIYILQSEYCRKISLNTVELITGLRYLFPESFILTINSLIEYLLMNKFIEELIRCG